MESGNKKETLFEKLSRVQTALIAPKNRVNSFGKYNYRSCEDILESVKPLLSENGLILTLSDEIVEISGRFYIKAIAGIADVETGEGLRVTAYARESEQKSGMDAAQITGSCSSYARKYALNGLFCIDDNKDPDTDEYSNESNERAKKTTRKKTDKPADSGAVPRGTNEGVPVEIESDAPKCADCGEEIKETDKYTVNEIVASTKKTFGVACCMKCGSIRYARLKADKARGTN